MLCATSIVSILVVGSWANAFIETAAIAILRRTNFVIFISTPSNLECPVFYNRIQCDRNSRGGPMLILVVRLTMKAGHEDEVIESFRKLQEETQREPGCVMYVVQRGLEN